MSAGQETEARQYIKQTIRRLKIGEAVTFAGDLIDQAYPGSIYSGFLEPRDPIDRIMMTLIGSTYGAYRARVDAINHTVTFSHHDTDGKTIYWVSPDRRDRFRQKPDGTWEHRYPPEER